MLANNGNPAGGGKSGYQFTTGVGAAVGGVNTGFTIKAVPNTINAFGNAGGFRSGRAGRRLIAIGG